jgi:N-acyl-D-aspartate/D-glutamate deacylase
MEMEMKTTVSEAGEEGRAEKLQRVLEQWQVTEPLWQLDDEEQRRRKLEDEEDREEYDRQFNEHRERYKTLSVEANQYMETIGSSVGQERINVLRQWSEIGRS